MNRKAMMRRATKARPYPAGVDVLKKFLQYVPGTGEFKSKVSFNPKPRIRNGHVYIKLPHDPNHITKGRRIAHYYRADHLAWYIVSGKWPDGWIEHVNGILADNRIENLVHRDTERVRWWHAPVETENGIAYHMVQVEEDPLLDFPALDIMTVTLQGNDGKLYGETIVRPRIASGWQVDEYGMERESNIDPAPSFERGEFGKDWE